MPHLFKNRVAVYQHELVPDFWKSANALRLEISRKKDFDYGIKQLEKGGNGRKMRVDYDSLPNYIKNQLKDPRKTDHILENYFEIDAAAVRFYKDFKRPNYGYLKREESDKYVINASVINALIKLEHARINERINKGHSARSSREVKSVKDSILEDSISFNEILEKLGHPKHNLPTHPRKFREKLNNYGNRNYLALIKDPEGKTLSNAKKVDDLSMELLNNLFSTQDHKPTATEVASQYDAFLDGYVEIINNKTGECYNPKFYKKISTTTVKSWLAKWENRPANELKRDNDRQKFMTKHIPYSQLDQPKYAGSIISIDDRQPPFKYPSGKSGKRMWFYMGIDLASQAIICWVYGKTKDELIRNFYQQLVRNYHDWGVNLPDGLECESSLNSSFTQTFLKNGEMFQDVRIEANSARSKRIEAYFRPLRYGLEKKREGWIARPHALSENNQQSKSSDKIIPYEQIIDDCLTDIVTWNNTSHNIEKQMSRWDYFLANQNPKLEPTNYKSFLPHLGNYTASSCNAGIVHFANKKWLLGDKGKICLGPDLIGKMKLVEAKDVDIFWIDDNQGQIIKAMIYNKDGRYLTELLPMPTASRAKIEETDAHREAKQIMDAYKATVTSFFKHEKNTREKLTIIDNRPRTLNNNFTIPGLKVYEQLTAQVEDLGSEDDEENEYPLLNNTQTSSGWASNFKV